MSATFSKNKDYNSTMTIHRTEMSIPTEHVIFSQIIGSKNGRLFAGGDNGKIYDIIYQVGHTHLKSNYVEGLDMLTKCIKRRKMAGCPTGYGRSIIQVPT